MPRHSQFAPANLYVPPTSSPPSSSTSSSSGVRSNTPAPPPAPRRTGVVGFVGFAPKISSPLAGPAMSGSGSAAPSPPPSKSKGFEFTFSAAASKSMPSAPALALGTSIPVIPPPVTHVVVAASAPAVLAPSPIPAPWQWAPKPAVPGGKAGPATGYMAADSFAAWIGGSPPPLAWHIYAGAVRDWSEFREDFEFCWRPANNLETEMDWHWC